MAPVSTMLGAAAFRTVGLRRSDAGLLPRCIGIDDTAAIGAAALRTRIQPRPVYKIDDRSAVTASATANKSIVGCPPPLKCLALPSGRTQRATSQGGGMKRNRWTATGVAAG